MLGQPIAHYPVLEKLGEGGMGVVYKARRYASGPLCRAQGPAAGEADAERKRRSACEARAASALNHPNIITIYDIDQDNGTDFIAGRDRIKRPG